MMGDQADAAQRGVQLRGGDGQWARWTQAGRRGQPGPGRARGSGAIYASGPGTYNTATWGDLGEGWEWVKAQHGKGASDRWTALGIESDGYLQHAIYPNTRLMLPGNTNWQQFWIDTYYEERWGGGRGQDHAGADALFSDGTGYQVPGAKHWRREGDLEQVDYPQEYYDDGYLHDRWRSEMNVFFARAVPQLEAKPEGIKLIPNFGWIETHPEYWSELEAQPHPPYAAMQEAGLVKSYGSFTFNYHGWSEKVEAMRDRSVPVVMICHGGAGDLAGADGLARMDLPAEDGITGTTGWDALWFAMTGFLMALNEDKSNGYLGFTVWTYAEYYWLDEFDPTFLHLGAPVGQYYVDEGVLFREFEDGWVVANPPYGKTITDIVVPRGAARVVTHDNLKVAGDAPLVTRFDLGSARGVVLLKPGRDIGNADNQGRVLLPIATIG